MTQETF
jgi:hypothetical protein